MSKVNLKAEAKKLSKEQKDTEGEITDAVLKDNCPEVFKVAFKGAKTQGQRVDFLYEAEKHRLEVQRDVEEMKKFIAILEKWFIQELPDTDTTGVAGEVARVQVKQKERPSVKDWDAFYTHIKKKGEFELLNRAVNVKSVKERWEAGKEVPGVEKYHYKDVSITKV